MKNKPDLGDQISFIASGEPNVNPETTKGEVVQTGEPILAETESGEVVEVQDIVENHGDSSE